MRSCDHPTKTPFMAAVDFGFRPKRSFQTREDALALQRANPDAT